jgi:murein DD-endopeptidase MepM/ murein hydrolase activator NlpD
MTAPAGSGQTLLPVPPVYTVAHGDTLGWVARHYHVSAREIAVANGLPPGAPLRVGTRLTIPLRTPTVAQPRPADSRPPPRVVAADPPLAANVHLATPVEPPPAAAANVAPAFRWPARGRIVNNYGARVNGSTNDGIDLAVPEGTPVRSADDGVVAYAGNELKGYGNLVLVRHANGFVTAYANGSELLVKRNDQVHKGQVIMTSGQTGNAAAPQLHFEIRKNSAPVDPTQYLPADKSASAPL